MILALLIGLGVVLAVAAALGVFALLHWLGERIARALHWRALRRQRGELRLELPPRLVRRGRSTAPGTGPGPGRLATDRRSDSPVSVVPSRVSARAMEGPRKADPAQPAETISTQRRH